MFLRKKLDATLGALSILGGRLDHLTAAVGKLAEENEFLRLRLLEMANMQSVPLFENTLITKTRHGFKMFIDGRDTGAGLEILTDGQTEPHVSRLFQKLIKPGSVFLDVGANFGYYTMYGALLGGPSCRVYAFEANHHLIPFIGRALYVNGFTSRVQVFNKAVSNRSGKAPFGFTFEKSGGGNLDHDGSEGAEMFEVELARIDDLVGPELIADCIKVDVEGHELQALLGMESLLRRSPHVSVILEYFNNIGGSSRGLQIADFMAGMGFKFWRIDSDGFLVEIDRDQLPHIGDVYLLVAREKPHDREIVLSLENFHRPNGDRSVLAGPVESVLLHGPYCPLNRGAYDIFIEGDITGTLEVRATHEFGLPIAHRNITSSAQSLRVGCPSSVRYFEVVVRPMTQDASLRLDRVRIVDAS